MFIDACSGLASALGSGPSHDLSRLATVLSDHPNEKTVSFAKKAAKQQRTEGAGLLNILPLVTFCKTASMPKHVKALEELIACSIKYGLDSADRLRESLETPVATSVPKTKSSNAESIAQYASHLSAADLSYNEAAKLIDQIEADKKVKVNDVRDIAALVVGVAMLKGRTRPQYLDEIRSRFIVLDREERKREASEAVSKPWGDG
jgi:hypothetical protein